MKKSLIVRAVICVILAAAGYIIGHYYFNIPYSHWIAKASYILSCIVIGYPIVINAFENLIHGDIFDENIIMIVTSIGVVVFSKLPGAIIILFLFEVGKGLQDLCIKVAEDTVKKGIIADTDKVVVKSQERSNYALPELVEIGETIVVKPGEKVPFDCRITQGKSFINSMDITGEQDKIPVKEGDVLLSGCYNLENKIEACVLKKYGDSYASQISRIIRNLDSEEEIEGSLIRKRVDNFTKVYSFIICLLAVLLVFIPPLLLKQAHRKWIERALTFLVVACPGAMLVTVPLAIMLGIVTCIRNGIILKNSNMLETVRNLKHIMFTKTGVITDGNYVVSDIVPKDISQEELIRIVAHAERMATHPIAFPLINLYKGKFDASKVKDFKEVPSRGVKANIFLSETIVGNERFLRENNIPFKNIKEQGTIIHVAVDGEYKGYFILSDELKQEVSQEIDILRDDAKVKDMYIISGDDSFRVVEAARKVGISECYSELNAEEKLETITNLKTRIDKKSTLAFIGDLKTDEQLLDKADLGIVLSQYDNVEKNKYCSIVSEDFSLMSRAIKIAKRTSAIIKENVYLIVIVKLALLVLGGLGYMNIWEIAFVNLAASFIAILHTMRVLK